MNKIQVLALFISLALLLLLRPAPGQASTEWPPFEFDLTPVYKAGKITYDLKFANQAEEVMIDVAIKIPLPPGTRFVEAAAQPTTSVSFDGSEVTFFTSVLHDRIRHALFVVEVTNPTMTVFTTHAWIAWKGNHPGDYLAEEVSLDLTRPPLDWGQPSSRLQLEVSATVLNDTITYTIYPKNIGRRMWDLKINVTLPEETTFLSAEAPAQFVTGFDGREVSFAAVELAWQAELEPLRFHVSTADVTAPFVVTHAWATWKNVGRSVGRNVVLQEEVRSGDLIVQPHASQYVVADTIGDTPFASYDLTSLALQEDGSALEITFYAVGEIGPVGEPWEYILYVDRDCRFETGAPRGNRGAEYWVRYRHSRGQAVIYAWNEQISDWRNPTPIQASYQSGDNMVKVWAPYELLADTSQFCWVGRTRYTTDAFQSDPPSDWISRDARVTQYQVIPAASRSITAKAPDKPAFEEGPLDNLPGDQINGTVSAFLSPASLIDLSGNLAIPLTNKAGWYDVHLFALPNGQEIANIPHARQPHFRFDGQRLLVNGEGNGGIESIFEYNLMDGDSRQVSEIHQDAHPFYDPGGNRVVYGNAEWVLGVNGQPRPFIFVQCGLAPPSQEMDPRCRSIAEFGKLIPAGQMGELLGSHPVWTSDDRIAYQGCNSWAGYAACGIYTVPAASTKGLSDGFIPRRLTDDPSDTPGDTKGQLIAFTSQREGDWEAYLMKLDGTGLKNISNSSSSNDGLPTFSPNGQWAAFVSDRTGRWAVWAAPVAGGPAQKLFDLPTTTPWGEGDRSWTNERLSWGP